MTRAFRRRLEQAHAKTVKPRRDITPAWRAYLRTCAEIYGTPEEIEQVDRMTDAQVRKTYHDVPVMLDRTYRMSEAELNEGLGVEPEPKKELLQ